ncbi:MAG: hypothetical protein WCV00_04610 [Verrucomicrobiia bacterium]
MKVSITILFMALTLRAAFCAESETVGVLIQQGDAQVANHQLRAALETFQKAGKLEPDNPDVLVRTSKQCGELIADAKSPSEARFLAETAFADAKRAVELAPDHAKAHLCLAIAYGRMTDYTSNRVKIEYSKFIRDETLKSLALDPTDEYAWHVIGRWHAGISGLNFLLKFFTKLVYGGLPDASYEEAAKYLKKAAEIAPQRILHHQELAKVYVALGKRSLAEKEWQAVLKILPADADDVKARREAKHGLGSDSNLRASARQPASNPIPPLAVIVPSRWTPVTASR